MHHKADAMTGQMEKIIRRRKGRKRLMIYRLSNMKTRKKKKEEKVRRLPQIYDFNIKKKKKKKKRRLIIIMWRK